MLNETILETRRVWNMGETGLPTVSTKVIKIVAEKGNKIIVTETYAEKGTNVTMALGVSATGQSIPPFFIFPKNRMQSILLEHASPDSVGIANRSGWMTAGEFLKFMAYFIKHANASKDSPTLLLLDNHTSHLSIDVIGMLIAHGISMISFPPRCFHKIQPLDVSVFGHLNTAFRTQCQACMENHIGKTLEIYHVPLIIVKCIDTVVTPKNIKSGFGAADIFSFNPNLFTEIGCQHIHCISSCYFARSWSPKACGAEQKIDSRLKANEGQYTEDTP